MGATLALNALSDTVLVIEYLTWANLRDCCGYCLLFYNIFSEGGMIIGISIFIETRKCRLVKSLCSESEVSFFKPTLVLALAYRPSFTNYMLNQRLIKRLTFSICSVGCSWVRVLKLSLDSWLNVRRKQKQKKYQSQPAITCSKLTIETLEQSVKCVQS